MISPKMLTDIKNAADFRVAKYGKLDIVLSSAAIIEKPYSRIMDFNILEFEQTLSVNRIGIFLGIKHAACVTVEARVKGAPSA